MKPQEIDYEDLKQFMMLNDNESYGVSEIIVYYLRSKNINIVYDGIQNSNDNLMVSKIRVICYNLYPEILVHVSDRMIKSCMKNEIISENPLKV
jgi:hypothetical protein